MIFFRKPVPTFRDHALVGRLFALMLVAPTFVALPGFTIAQQRLSAVETLYADLAALPGNHMVQGDNYLYQGVDMQHRNPRASFAIVYSAPILATNDVLAINRNAPNPYAAALFADWTLTPESQHYLATRLRGPVALKHPYLPEGVALVDNVDPPREVMERLLGYWRRYVEKNR